MFTKEGKLKKNQNNKINGNKVGETTFIKTDEILSIIAKGV